MKVYKVVTTRQGDQYFSAIVSCNNLSFSVEYVIGEKAEPKIPDTPLFAFKTYEDALMFCLDTTCSNTILECEAELFSNDIGDIFVCQQVLFLKADRMVFELIHDFWDWFLNYGNTLKINSYIKTDFYKGMHIYKAPKGTVLCSSITPIRECE